MYNHYLQLIRDTSGINESMDGTTPKGDMLVGVQQNAITQGNNAIHDITNASMMMYKKVVQDIVKCLQIIPMESVLFRIYHQRHRGDKHGSLELVQGSVHVQLRCDSREGDGGQGQGGTWSRTSRCLSSRVRSTLRMPSPSEA